MKKKLGDLTIRELIAECSKHWTCAGCKFDNKCVRQSNMMSNPHCEDIDIETEVEVEE